MTVSKFDSDYSKKLRSSGGPLMMRGAEWNNEGDHLVTKDEFADFCFTGPYANIISAPIGMKVDGDRLFDTIAGPGKAKCPPTAPAPAAGASVLGVVALLLLAFGVW